MGKGARIRSQRSLTRAERRGRKTQNSNQIKDMVMGMDISQTLKIDLKSVHKMSSMARMIFWEKYKKAYRRLKKYLKSKQNLKMIKKVDENLIHAQIVGFGNIPKGESRRRLKLYDKRSKKWAS
jgi:hypothetical protein